MTRLRIHTTTGETLVFEADGADVVDAHRRFGRSILGRDAGTIFMRPDKDPNVGAMVPMTGLIDRVYLIRTIEEDLSDD